MPNPTLTSFTEGDLVISLSGDGDGSGTYTDNQASPITLYEITTSGTLVGQLVLPQTTTVVNGTTEYAISGEYGSSSEGSLQLSADGQSLVIMGYGINAATYNEGGAAVYGNAALAQSTSLFGTSYTPVARVVADISYNGSVDTSTALYNIYDTNNPRSVATVNGTVFYMSGQGVKPSSTQTSNTQGVYEAADGGNSVTSIDNSTDTRTAEIIDGELYVSRDSTQGTGGTSNIANYGTILPTGTTTPTVLGGIDGTITLTAAQENTVDASAVGTTINLSPENFFFASPTVLYVADGGNPKEGGLGDGGLQKWMLIGNTWTLEYTLSEGLDLVADTGTAGSTGLIGLTGVVNNGTVDLYATNSTIGDLDPTYVYSIADTLDATAPAVGESFTELMAAPADSNIRGIAFAPTQSTTAPTNVTVVSGNPQPDLSVTSGSTLTVQSGGEVISTTILSAGTATVSGTDLDGFIAHGGYETLFGGAIGDQIDGIQLVSAATATVSGETVNNGGTVELFLKGATASGVDVTTGGALFISGNATGYNTVIAGGILELQSPKAVLSGALTFSGAGTLEVTSMASGGYGDLAVISGFGVGDVVELSIIPSGGTLTTSVVSGNTVATVASGAISQSFTFAGTIGSELTLTSGLAEIEVVAPAALTSTVTSGQTLPDASVVSGGTLTVNGGGTITAATISAGGSVVLAGVDSGSTILSGGFELVTGSAAADLVYGQQLISANTAVVSNETVFNGGSVDLFLKGGIVNDLTVSSGGQFNINGNATGFDTVLSTGGTIDLQSPKANLTGTLTFAGPALFEFTDISSAGFGDLAVISGFTSGDVIDETVIGTGATLTSSVVSGNTVETVTSGSVTESFIFAGTYTTGYFHLSPDSGTGVEITAAGTPCYCRGTRIATDRGERLVEELVIGDRLVTLSGAVRPIKWIGRRSYAGQFASGNKAVLPVVIRAGALADGVPRRDLSVSPLHALFLDGVLIPASALVNGTSIVQANAVDRVEYIHLELETHDVILAEGAPSETFVDDDSRLMFQNSGEYRALYPGDVRLPARYCAPRVEVGEMLESVRRRLADRAGSGSQAARSGELLGRLDEVTADRISGWARDAGQPDRPVRLRVIDNGVVIGEVLADRYRPDLEAAGIGSGRHAFELVVPGGLSPYERHVIEVRRSEDGALLAGSPHVLAAAAMATVALAASSPARGRLDVVTRERITGWAQNAEDPATPVALQILANGRPIARVLANQYRPDLAAAGIGTGWHSFDVAIPGGLSPLTRQVIQVRQERDGAELPGSPSVIEAAESFDSVVEQAVARAVAAVGSQDERERVLSFIAAQADRLLQQQADGETGRLSRNAQRRLAPGLRALVIDERVPVAGRDAGSQAVLSHMQALQRLGYAVSFIAAEQMTAPAGGLEAIGVQPCRAPFYASVEDVLRRQADGIDLVYLHRAQIASRYLGLVRAYAPRARVIYSVADLHHVRLERQAAVEDRPDLLGESRRLRLEECRAAWAADAVITHSAVEAALLRQAVPEANVHVVGWDLKVRPTRVPAAAREGLAFIGNYAHQPNADAARWLVEAVMPLVWRADPSITCRLVGGGMTEPVRQLAGARVEVVGHVADLSTGVFDRVRLTVAPLRFGAGLKGKVLESFAAGVPCVMSPVAAEGLPTELQALVGADAAELAALIIRVHRDAECADAADAGLAWVANAFSAASVTRGLQAAVSGAHSVDRRIQPGKVAG